MDDPEDLEAAGWRRDSLPVDGPAVNPARENPARKDSADINPAKEAANRRLAAALRANLKRRKVAGPGKGGARPTGDRRG